MTALPPWHDVEMVGADLEVLRHDLMATVSRLSEERDRSEQLQIAAQVVDLARELYCGLVWLEVLRRRSAS